MNKTCVVLDADTEIRYYYLMRARKQIDDTDKYFFDAHRILSSPKRSNKNAI